MAEAGKVKVTTSGGDMGDMMRRALENAAARIRLDMDRMLSEAVGLSTMQAVSGGVLTRDELRKAADMVAFPRGEAVMPRANAERMQEIRRAMFGVQIREGLPRMELDRDGNPVGRVVFGIDAAVGSDRAFIRAVSSCGGRYEPKNVPSLYGRGVTTMIVDEYEDGRRIDPRGAFDVERVVARYVAGLDRENAADEAANARERATHNRATAMPSRRLATNMHRNDRVVLRLDREDALDGGQ